MTATGDPIWNDLFLAGPTWVGNSARWFPELHARGLPALAAHYGLGMIGELGELDEVLYVTRVQADLPGEIADVLIYAVDLATILGIELRGPDPVLHHGPPMLVDIGTVANAVKKLNRYRSLVLEEGFMRHPRGSTVPLAEADIATSPCTDGMFVGFEIVKDRHGAIDACATTIEAPLRRLMWRTLNVARAQAIDVVTAVESKIAVCEGRWG